MGIVFKKETQQFYLNTEHTSYIIELLNGRIPLHAYWGKKLENMLPLAAWGGVAASRLRFGLNVTQVSPLLPREFLTRSL